MAVGKFEKDIMHLVNKLCEGEESYISREIRRLGDSLISMHKKNLVKINHSVMELVCAKYLISDGYYVEVERVLDGLSCDIYAQKGLGALIVEVETGFIPPEHALYPLTYLKARIASKIPVSLEEIRNARIHAVYILDIENGIVEETEPSTYVNMVRPMLYGIEGLNPRFSKIVKNI